jgi:hypothetical protein
VKNIFVLSALFLVLAMGNVLAQKAKPKQPLSNQLVQLRGKVQVVERHKELSLRPNAFIIFQRVDCSKCFVGVEANGEGEYEVYLSKGTYRVLVYEFDKNQRLYNALAPRQKPVVNLLKTISNSVDGETFDIKIILKQPLTKNSDVL